MAVASVKEKFEDRTGSFHPANAEELVRSWLVTVDSKYDTAYTIRDGYAFPAYLAAHPDNLFYTCRKLTINPAAGGGWKFWIATATYSTAPLDQDEKEKQEHPNPLDRRTKLKLVSVKSEIYTLTDKNGDIRVNSAGDSYPPQPKIIGDLGFQLTKNIATRPTYLFAAIDSINDADWTVQGITIPAGKGKLEDFELSEEMEENGQIYFVATALVIGRKRGWLTELPDEGFHYLDGGVRTAITIPDDEGNQVRPTESQLLDGSGGILDEAADPVINEFEDLDEYDFGNLPFT